MKRSGLRKISALCLMACLLTQMAACSIQRRAVAGRQFSILGLGDSITEGGADFSSYLFPLDSMMKQAGYQAKFIGPRRSIQGGDTLFHSGFSGRTAEFLAARVDSIYSLYPADIVLLHSGHNHFVEELPVAGIISAHRTIIKTVRRKNQSAHILVAGVITSGKLPKYGYIPELNASIKALVDSLNDPAIVFVNQQRGWDWSQYTISDKVHPNRIGAQEIALKWFSAITKILRKKL
jgi:acetyl esterase